MSRIHEALKRAEQERAAAHSGGAAPPVPDNAGDGQGVAEEASPLSGLDSPFAQFTLESLLSRCPRSAWTPDTKTMLFFGSEEPQGTEPFRTLRSRLYQLREKLALKKLLVTSSLPREGKSFVAANLAQVLVRQQGRRVLLLDCDLRAARLHAALGTPASPGVSDYLLGKADEFAITQQGPMENLFFIPSGRAVSDPAELVANDRLKTLLNRMEVLFDWVILDSPPAVPVSDAGLLAKYCDGVLLVVRSGTTPFDLARKARDEFGDKNLGVVLNAMDSSSAYPPYYYGNYGRTNGRGEVKR